MHIKILLVAGLACFSVAPAHAQTPALSCSLADLRWLAGTWRNAPPADSGEERWVLVPDGSLMGSSWTYPAKGAGFAEAMAIVADGGQVVMRLRHFDRGLKGAWEEKSAPMIFALSKCDENTAVFSADESHAGERLTYSRSGAELTIVGDFIHQGKPLRVEFHLIKNGAGF
ncbi:MAG: DUF6265 family protein [Steroidobacteraceae bacterium]